MPPETDSLAGRDDTEDARFTRAMRQLAKLGHSPFRTWQDLLAALHALGYPKVPSESGLPQAPSE